MISPKQRAFLKAYVISGSVLKAAEATKVQRGMHYRWKEDAEYLAAFEAARLEFADVLEAVVIERAVVGVLEPVYYKGKPCGAIRRYSDGNAQFLLRGLRPDIYRERVSVTGKDDEPLEVKPILPEWLLKHLKPAAGDTNPFTVKENSTDVS